MIQRETNLPPGDQEQIMNEDYDGWGKHDYDDCKVDNVQNM